MDNYHLSWDAETAYKRLHPTVREYIYEKGWTVLRPIQTAACELIFETRCNMLLSSNTASGKTEAAFLPIISELIENPPVTVGVLYIAPMKALINDQYERMGPFMEKAGINLCDWHGDVPQSRKNKLMQDPRGVLQITPESLESMLINKLKTLDRYFMDLRYVIIDEAHIFMSSDRGMQVMCLLERLTRTIGINPRRIGLSATIGDIEKAAEWLGMGSGRDTLTPLVKNEKQLIRISVEHFERKERKAPDSAENKLTKDKRALSETKADITGNISEKDMEIIPKEAGIYLYEKSLGKKAIIFGNGRENPDGAIAQIKKIAEERGTPDVYHVHHGSISPGLREDAERELREKEGSVVTGATVTLEMGIDISGMDRVFQLNRPISVASFVQRMGRSGRRGNPAEMFFIASDKEVTEKMPLPERIAWQLAHITAVIELYVKDRWIEPYKPKKQHFGMFYHQMMSILISKGGMTVPDLINETASLACFSDMLYEDCEFLINYLIELGHIQKMHEGTVIVGLEAEKIVSSYRFYAVFPEEEEWDIIKDSLKIGTVEYPMGVGEFFSLAGRVWEVTGIDDKRKVIFVKPAKANLKYLWKGDRALTHNRILEKIKQVLSGREIYPYLSETAANRLEHSREVFRQMKLSDYNLYFDEEKEYFYLFPWKGHIDYSTIINILEHYEWELRISGGYRPYYIRIKARDKYTDVLGKIQAAFAQNPDPHEFTPLKLSRRRKKECEYKTPKYDCYVPDELIRKALFEDYIDVASLAESAKSWK